MVSTKIGPIGGVAASGARNCERVAVSFPAPAEAMRDNCLGGAFRVAFPWEPLRVQRIVTGSG